MSTVSFIPPVHSLLLARAGADIDFCGRLPEWLDLSKGEATWLIRTRAPCTPMLWSAGIRGRTRSERHTVRISPTQVQRVVTPAQLGATLPFQGSGTCTAPAIQAVSQVRSLLKHYESHFSWGPTGSVALEFASGGGQWVHADSDLDIVLNTPVRIEKEVAVRLVTEFAALAVRVDALIEGPAGALSLQEWAMRAAPWLVRTEEGPILTATPWAVMGCRSVS